MTVGISLANRPFAVEPLTGIQLPDGIFDAALPRLMMTAQFRNDGANPLDLRIYFESASDPGINVGPQTHILRLLPGAVTFLSWRIDVTTATAGAHYVSFGLEDSNGNTGRAIRKIFVSRTTLDSDGSFLTEVPEGTLRVRIQDLYGPVSGPGCEAPHRKQYDNLLEALADYIRDPSYGPEAWMVGPYLLHNVELSLDPNPHYAGQLGDLPFSDSDWKTILLIIAIILAIAAVVVAIVAGIAVITIGTGGGGAVVIGVTWACCVGPAVGAAIAASALLIGGMVAATTAALGDFPGPFRVGQENTRPGAGEITVAEAVSVEFRYPEAIQPGSPFHVEANWKYERTTRDAAGNQQVYRHSQIDNPTNTHLLSRYEVDALDVVRTYQNPRWVVRARFYDENKAVLRGGDLFVQCYLAGPHGEAVRLQMKDDGILPDVEPNDGWYTGEFTFVTRMSGGFNSTYVAANPRDDSGMWQFFVLAQDVDTAQPNMTAEEAAAHLGGILRTGQAQITLTGGVCPLVPDGHIEVV